MYEQQIKVGVTGLETAEKAVSTTAALEDRTRRLAQVIADRLAGDEKLLGKQLDSEERNSERARFLRNRLREIDNMN